MSLSKPFPVSHLPLVALENVLLLTDPGDLLLFALSVEKARELLRKFSLVNYFDINVYKNAVIFWISFKTGKQVKWKFTMSLPTNASVECRNWANFELRDGTKNNARLFKLDDMKMVLWETMFQHPDEMRCSLPKEHFVDYIRRIGYLFQSICPGQRIRQLGAGNVGWEDEKVLLFHMDRITRCEKFHFYIYDGDNLLEILEKTDVKRKIYLECDQDEDLSSEWMNNEKIRNIPNLTLIEVKNLHLSPQFLSLDNEHIHLLRCEVNGSVVNEYLKKWVNGEFTKRKTLTVSECYCLRFDDMIDGLTQEPVETWEKLGKPDLVQFSNKLCLNPTPRTVPEMYQTVLLKNCHGQFATVLHTYAFMYFTPWDHHPLPPIKIPKGHKLLWQGSEWPLVMIVHQNYENPDFS